jgi:hypothetical protein
MAPTKTVLCSLPKREKVQTGTAHRHKHDSCSGVSASPPVLLIVAGIETKKKEEKELVRDA